MRFDFVTLFGMPVRAYFEESIMSRAINAGLIDVAVINPRNYSKDKWHKVDDYAIGGGAGLTLMCEPYFACLDELKKQGCAKIIFVTPNGKPFKQNDAKRLAKESSVAFVCGRYEGFDERIIEKYADEVFSIGDFIVSGGELPAMMMADAIARNIKGVLGNNDSLSIESFENNLLEAPTFTKPFDCEPRPPHEFIGGNHAAIRKLKHKMSLCKTKYFRPDLVRQG